MQITGRAVRPNIIPQSAGDIGQADSQTAKDDSHVACRRISSSDSESTRWVRWKNDTRARSSHNGTICCIRFGGDEIRREGSSDPVLSPESLSDDAERGTHTQCEHAGEKTTRHEKALFSGVVFDPSIPFFADSRIGNPAMRRHHYRRLIRYFFYRPTSILERIAAGSHAPPPGASFRRSAIDLCQLPNLSETNS